jgi:hypothetical protein
MKLLLTITSILLSFLILPQDVKLKGKYKMEYEPEYNEQNCIILFKDNAYERRLTNGKTIKGTILYKDFEVALFDKTTNLQMDFLKQSIKKDTIYFGTRNVNHEPEKRGKIIIYSGRLIRIK